MIKTFRPAWLSLRDAERFLERRAPRAKIDHVVKSAVLSNAVRIRGFLESDPITPRPIGQLVNAEVDVLDNTIKDRRQAGPRVFCGMDMGHGFGTQFFALPAYETHKWLNVEINVADLDTFAFEHFEIVHPIAPPSLDRQDYPSPVLLPLKQAGEDTVHETIKAIYDHADRHGMKPPNVKELPDHVTEILRWQGKKAGRPTVDKIATEFGNRRRKPGPRVNGSLPPFSLEHWAKSGVKS